MEPTDKRIPNVEQWEALAEVIDKKIPAPLTGETAPTTSTEGKIGQFYINSTDNKLYVLKEITEDSGTTTYTWEEVGGSDISVVQSRGTSTTDVMSQNATTGLVFTDPANRRRVNIGGNADNLVDGSVVIGRNAANAITAGSITSGPVVAIGNSAQTYSQNAIAIGSGASAGYSISNLLGTIAIGNVARAGYQSSLGNYTIAIGPSAQAGCGGAGDAGGVAIGYSAVASQRGSVAIGACSSSTVTGKMDIGTTNTSYGYKSSAYRLLSGLYDPQTEHDAATKGYVDTAVAGVSGAEEITNEDWSALWQ